MIGEFHQNKLDLMILEGDSNKLIFLYLLFSLLICSCNSPKEIKPFSTLKGFAQGTTYSIKYQDFLERDFTKSIDSILIEIDNQLSTYDSTSFISIINNAEDSCFNLKEKNLFSYCFNFSKIINQRTSGLFNPAVYPLVNYWGFYSGTDPLIDSNYIRDSLLVHVNLDSNFEIKKEGNESFICKKNKNSKLDFNAVAQGYSVDLVSEFLDDRGINNYLVEIGGELSSKGFNSNGDYWKIGIEKPVDSSLIGQFGFQRIVELKNSSLATSGNYRKFKIINGQKVSHSINPNTGFPSNNSLLSVTVICKMAANADALATSFMLMGKEKSIEYVNKNKSDSIFCYLIYDSLNNLKEWSNF